MSCLQKFGDLCNNDESCMKASNRILCCSVEKKKVKKKHLASLYHVAIKDLPDAALSAELLAHAEKYIAYFQR